MAAFTTTSPASTYVINTLVLIAVLAVAGVIASYVMLNHTPTGPSAAVATTQAAPATLAEPHHAN